MIWVSLPYEEVYLFEYCLLINIIKQNLLNSWLESISAVNRE